MPELVTTRLPLPAMLIELPEALEVTVPLLLNVLLFTVISTIPLEATVVEALIVVEEEVVFVLSEAPLKLIVPPPPKIRVLPDACG